MKKIILTTEQLDKITEWVSSDMSEDQDLGETISSANSNNYEMECDVDLDYYASVDQAWVELGLAAPARRALIDDGLFKLSDLRKTSLAALKELHGMGPNAIRILTTEMKKADLSFRK